MPKRKLGLNRGEADFSVNCNAGEMGQFRVRTNSLSVSVGQRARGQGSGDMWDSVVVHCSTKGGRPLVRVLICNPDWDEPIEIARIRSEFTKRRRGKKSVEVQLRSPKSGARAAD